MERGQTATRSAKRQCSANRLPSPSSRSLQRIAAKSRYAAGDALGLQLGADALGFVGRADGTSDQLIRLAFAGAGVARFKILELRGVTLGEHAPIEAQCVERGSAGNLYASRSRGDRGFDCARSEGDRSV